MGLTGLQFDTQKFNHSTPQYNKYFTIMDLLNMRKYSDDTLVVTDKELNYLSEKGRAFNKFFGNDEYLTLKDMIPESIETDIENHIKSIGWTPDKG